PPAAGTLWTAGWGRRWRAGPSGSAVHPLHPPPLPPGIVLSTHTSTHSKGLMLVNSCLCLFLCVCVRVTVLWQSSGSVLVAPESLNLSESVCVSESACVCVCVCVCVCCSSPRHSLCSLFFYPGPVLAPCHQDNYSNSLSLSLLSLCLSLYLSLSLCL